MPAPTSRSVPGSGTAFVASSVSDRAFTVRVNGTVPVIVVEKTSCDKPDSVMSDKHVRNEVAQVGTKPPVSASDVNETRKGAEVEVDGPNWK